MTKKEILAEYLKVSIDKILETDDYDFEYDNRHYNVLNKLEVDARIKDNVDYDIYDLERQLRANDFGFILDYINYYELEKDTINNTYIEDILEGEWFNEYYISQE